MKQLIYRKHINMPYIIILIDTDLMYNVNLKIQI